ncbi:hypothetical protein [Nocardioides daejeonensis]|uniref:hypothetical protein n=1 Tax=Nocardioides daejeonensis TaxID=1046556 RepID=UPI000D74B9F1|nr:hypothetical protein [Nocardioides daejeonensis]
MSTHPEAADLFDLLERRAGVAGDSQDALLARVREARELEEEARTVLHHAVIAARDSGVTWQRIGETLGVSKQAAQKRFPATLPGDLPLAADERIIGPVTAFDEMGELNLAGRYGWHSVAPGLLHHRVVRGATQWEHKRVAGARASRRLQEQGWEWIGNYGFHHYLKRDLGTPALTESGK